MQLFRSKTGFFLVLLVVATMLSGCKSNDYQVLQSKESSAGESNIETKCNGELASNTDSCTACADDSCQSISASCEDVSDEVIVVYVCGAVNNSGVYELSSGSRIADAVEAAGGFSEEADTEYLNLAMTVSDGMKIQIPTVDETSELKESGDKALSSGTSNGTYTDDHFVETSDGEAVDTNKATSDDPDKGTGSDNSLVNINTATKEELCSLSGIGESRAAAIISYREQNGPFSCIEDIKKVSGIKDKVFEQIKDRITV